MDITNVVSAFFAPRAPIVNTEQHMAALVAKLYHQAATYQRWQDSLGDEAPVDASESLRLDYEIASANVREVQELLRATPTEPDVLAKPHVAALQASAQNLAVTHMSQLRDDEVIAEGNLKIFKSFAHKATLGWGINPVEVQQTRDARDAQAQVVRAIKQARQRAVQSANDATYNAICDAIQRPSMPYKARPQKSILKQPNLPSCAKKTVRWDPDMLKRQTLSDAADWVGAEDLRAGAVSETRKPPLK